MRGLWRRRPWKRAPEPPPPPACIVIDGKEVEGYELPPWRQRDATAARQSWEAHEAALAEQHRTRLSRVLSAFLTSARTDREIADVLLRVADDEEIVRRIFHSTSNPALSVRWAQEDIRRAADWVRTRSQGEES